MQQFDDRSADRIVETVLRSESDVRQRPRKGKRGYGGGGAGVFSSGFREGVVKTGTAAVWVVAPADGIEPGSVEIWPYVDAEAFNATDDYDAERLVHLTPAEHDATVNYSAGDLVAQAGKVQQADAAVSAGAFDAADWTELADVGDRYLADSAVTAGPFDAAEWSATDVTRKIYRAEPTVTLAHYWDGTPAAGALVLYQPTRLLGIVCEAYEGFV